MIYGSCNCIVSIICILDCDPTCGMHSYYKCVALVLSFQCQHLSFWRSTLLIWHYGYIGLLLNRHIVFTDKVSDLCMVIGICSPIGYMVHRHWWWLVIIWRSLDYVKYMVWILGFGIFVIGLIGLTYLLLLTSWSRLSTGIRYLFQISMTRYGHDLLIGYCCNCIE